MTLIAGLCLLLACAHVSGWLAERFRQPALLGQMLAGILVGPSMLNWLKPDGGLAAIADLSVLFVVITAGLEMRMQHLLDVLRGKGFVALLLGLLVPIVAASIFTFVLGLPFVPAVVVVLCTSVTALPVALRILSTFGLLNTRVARVAVASALMTDIIVVLALGILIAVATRRSDAVLSITVGMALAKLALLVGMFLASLLITGDLIGDLRCRNLVQTCELMTVSVFGPLFLAYQGLQFEIGAFRDGIFVLTLTAIAVVSKLLGGYVMGRLKVLPHYEACGVGIVMNSRGVMEMVIASIAYRAGLVSQSLFSALLIVGVIATAITPSLLRYWLRDTTKMRAMLSAGESSA